MGYRVNIYLRDEREREVVRLALAMYRAKLAAGALGEVVEIVKTIKQEEPAEPETIALPSNEDREIPFQLQRFIDSGWDLDTAFRIYDEYYAELAHVGEGVSYVKPLSERFMEERMKRDADENSK